MKNVVMDENHADGFGATSLRLRGLLMVLVFNASCGEPGSPTSAQTGASVNEEDLSAVVTPGSNTCMESLQNPGSSGAYWSGCEVFMAECAAMGSYVLDQGLPNYVQCDNSGRAVRRELYCVPAGSAGYRWMDNGTCLGPYGCRGAYDVVRSQRGDACVASSTGGLPNNVRYRNDFLCSCKPYNGVNAPVYVTPANPPPCGNGVVDDGENACSCVEDFGGSPASCPSDGRPSKSFHPRDTAVGGEFESDCGSLVDRPTQPFIDTHNSSQMPSFPSPFGCGGVEDDEPTAGPGISLRDGALALQLGCLSTPDTFKGIPVSVGISYRVTRALADGTHAMHRPGSANLPPYFYSSYSRRLAFITNDTITTTPVGIAPSTWPQRIKLVAENGKFMDFVPATPGSPIYIGQFLKLGEGSTQAQDARAVTSVVIGGLGPGFTKDGGAPLVLNYLNGWKDTFDKDGFLIGQEDPFGNRIFIRHQVQNQDGTDCTTTPAQHKVMVKRIESWPVGATTAFQWMEMHHAWRQVVRENGRFRGFWSLETIKTSTGREAQLAYDTAGNVTSVTWDSQTSSAGSGLRVAQRLVMTYDNGILRTIQYPRANDDTVDNVVTYAHDHRYLSVPAPNTARWGFPRVLTASRIIKGADDSYATRSVSFQWGLQGSGASQYDLLVTHPDGTTQRYMHERDQSNQDMGLYPPNRFFNRVTRVFGVNSPSASTLTEYHPDTKVVTKSCDANGRCTEYTFGVSTMGNPTRFDVLRPLTRKHYAGSGFTTASIPVTDTYEYGFVSGRARELVKETRAHGTQQAAVIDYTWFKSGAMRTMRVADKTLYQAEWCGTLIADNRNCPFGELKSVQGIGQPKLTFSYHATQGYLEKTTHANDQTEKWEYNDKGCLTRWTNLAGVPTVMTPSRMADDCRAGEVVVGANPAEAITNHYEYATNTTGLEDAERYVLEKLAVGSLDERRTSLLHRTTDVSGSVAVVETAMKNASDVVLARSKERYDTNGRSLTSRFGAVSTDAQLNDHGTSVNRTYTFNTDGTSKVDVTYPTGNADAVSAGSGHPAAGTTATEVTLFNASGQVTRVVDGMGNLTDWFHDANSGELIRQVQPGQQTLFAYDILGRAWKQRSRTGSELLDETEYSYEFYNPLAEGQVQTVVSSLERTRFTYDEYGRVTQEDVGSPTDANASFSRTTRYEKDGAGRRVELVTWREVGKTQQVRKYLYATATAETGRQDCLSQVLEVLPATPGLQSAGSGGILLSQKCDSLGRVVVAGQASIPTMLGDDISTVLQPTLRTYSPNGLTLRQERTTEFEPHLVALDPLHPDEFTMSSPGQVFSFRQYDHDALGRTRSVTEGSSGGVNGDWGIRTTSIDYQPGFTRVTHSGPTNATQTLHHHHGRTYQESWTAGAQAEPSVGTKRIVSFDNLGRPTNISFGGGCKNLQYDTVGNVTVETRATVAGCQYAADVSNTLGQKLTTRTDFQDSVLARSTTIGQGLDLPPNASNTVNHWYTTGRLTGQNVLGQTVWYGHKPDGRFESATLGDMVYSHVHEGAGSQLSEINVTRGGQTLLRSEFTPNDRGLIGTVRNSVVDSTNQLLTYETTIQFDPVRKLPHTVSYPAVGDVAQRTVSLEWDGANRLTRNGLYSFKHDSKGSIISAPGLQLDAYGNLRGVPDRNGDMNHDFSSDVAWASGTGAFAVWYLNGTTLLKAVLVPTDGNTFASANSHSMVEAMGDVDGDGTPDWVLRESNGSARIGLWMMQAPTSRLDPPAIRSTVVLGSVADTTWKIVGLVDVDHDGVRDIVWQRQFDPARQNWPIAAWLLNGDGTLKGYGSLGQAGPATWRVEQLADFDGNGVPDLLWRSEGGALALWLMEWTETTSGRLPWLPLRNMNPYHAIQWQNAGTTAALAGTWKIVGAGDYNGDFRPDILWYLPDNGGLAYWTVKNRPNAQNAALPEFYVDTYNWLSLRAGDTELPLPGSMAAASGWHPVSR